MAYVSANVPTVSAFTKSLRQQKGYDLMGAKVYTKAGKLLDSLTSFSCPKCNLILRDPHQLLECGCRYCKPCLDSLLATEDSDPRCPEDDEPISKEEVRLDRGCLREISSLKIECPGSEQSCQWTGGLSEYEEHFDNCQFVLVKCSDCDETVMRGDLANHALKCPANSFVQDDSGSIASIESSKSSGHGSMIVNCAYPGCNFSSDYDTVNEHLMEHMHSLAQIVMSMQDKMTQLLGEYSKIKKTEEDLQQVVLNYEQQFKNLKPKFDSMTALQQEIKDIRKELSEVKRIEADSAHSRLKSLDSSSFGSSSSGGYGSGSASLGTNRDEFRGLVPRVGYLEREIALLKPTVSDAKAEIVAQRSQLAGYIDTVQTMQESVTRHTVLMEEIKLRQDILDVKTVHGVFIWKIPEIARRFRDAQDKRTISLYSPPFHTSPHGYRSCIRAYLNGDGSGKGTHVSVFFVLMKSEHDNLLKWPFDRPVTFELVNQENRTQSITETFMPDKRSASFQQPKSEMNVASGFPRFAPHHVLSEHQFIKGDAMYIRCKIDTNGLNFE